MLIDRNGSALLDAEAAPGTMKNNDATMMSLRGEIRMMFLSRLGLPDIDVGIWMRSRADLVISYADILSQFYTVAATR